MSIINNEIIPGRVINRVTIINKESGIIIAAASDDSGKICCKGVTR